MFQLHKKLFITGGYNNQTSTAVDDHFSVSIQQEEEKLVPMLSSKCFHSMTGHNSIIITTGGKNSTSSLTGLKNVEKYEILKRKWFKYPEMEHYRSKHSSCIANNTLFIFTAVDCSLIV